MASGSSKGYGKVRNCPDSPNLRPHRVLLLASNLAWCLKVDTEQCQVTLIALADILDRVNVKRDSKAMNRQDDGRRFSINENLNTT